MGRPSQYNWDKIRGLYETGHKTQVELCKEFGIPKGTMSDKIKSQNWAVSELTNKAISDAVQVSEQLSNIPEHLTEPVSQIIKDKTKHLKLINDVVAYGISLIGRKMKEEGTRMSMTNLKSGIEAVDKGSLTLGVNQRHSNTNIINGDIEKDTPVEFCGFAPMIVDADIEES